METIKLKIREDRWGPGMGGFGRHDDCGCLMSQLCRHLGLEIREQDRPADIEDGEGKYRVTPLGAKLPVELEPHIYNRLVSNVQCRNDDFWRALLRIRSADESGQFYGKTREAFVEECLDNARRVLGEALTSLRGLGVEVEWVGGDDFAPPAAAVLEHYRSLRSEVQAEPEGS